MAKPALGRGLSGLLGASSPAARGPVASPAQPPPGGAATPNGTSGAGTPPGPAAAQKVELSKIHPCPFQPRKDFSPEALQELADSIQSQGIVQPLIVRRQGERFEIIAGERRWRAAQLAGLKEAPVILRDADDREVLELALIENLQRENLNPIEEALGYSELIEKFQLRQEDAAAKVGKSRTAVANALRLLRLPEPVKTHLREGRLSAGHAKVLLGLTTAEQQEKAAARVLHDGLNVRQTEEFVAHLNTPAAPRPATPGLPAATEARDPNIVAVEARLREKLGTRVRLRYAKGKGALEVKFFSDDELQRILDLLGIRID
ncbi:MAG TPA: chromosome partitioning protein ParB [Verrucomicrobiales bacterium]|nr:chromosome partitioning protein ParB [Verrucomicrobiales bacterium]